MRITRQHGVNANHVFIWRRLYLQSRLGEVLARDDGLLPVAPATTPAVANNDIDGIACTIVVEVAPVRVRIQGRIDASVTHAGKSKTSGYNYSQRSLRVLSS